MNLRSLALSHSRNAGWTSVLSIFSSLPGVSWYSKHFGQSSNRKPRIVFFSWWAVIFVHDVYALDKWGVQPPPRNSFPLQTQQQIHRSCQGFRLEILIHGHFLLWRQCWEPLHELGGKTQCLRSLQRLLLASCEKGFLAVFCPFFSGKFLRKISRQVQQKVEWSRKLHVCFEVVKRYCSSILEPSAPWN